MDIRPVAASPEVDNIALNKQTFMRNGSRYGRAVDGLFEKYVETDKEFKLWWSVDLEKQTIITHVTIYKTGKNAVISSRITCRPKTLINLQINLSITT